MEKEVFNIFCDESRQDLIAAPGSVSDTNRFCCIGGAMIPTVVRGMMILPPHGKEFFHAAVSSFLPSSVRTFLHDTVSTFLHHSVSTFFHRTVSSFLH